MALNLSCWNNQCKFYYEDSCVKHLNNETIYLNFDGQCTNFQRGKNESYKESEAKKMLCEKSYIDGTLTSLDTDCRMYYGV